MSNAALLVDCHKIINWLEDRKKLRKDWYTYLKAAEQKLKSLLKERDWTISYPNIHQYITQNEHNFNHLDVLALVDMILQTDLAHQKNLLFGYSDKNVKEWATLKKYMEGNNINLLSLAKFIEQSLRFDLPGLNKSVESIDNQLVTLKRKIDFNNNTIFQQKTALTKEKNILGIQVNEGQTLLIQRLVEILIGRGPKQIDNLLTMVQSESMKRYINDYNAINLQNQTPNELETLQFFMNNGDEFLQVYQDISKKAKFQKVKKYLEFTNWKGSNQWQIEIEGQSKNQSRALNQSTVIESRQFRQKLLYNLSQLLFFYKGLKYEIGTSEKSIGVEQNNKHSSIVEGEANGAINEIEKIISFLTSKRLTSPLELKNSKKAYQILVGQFLGFQANIATMENQIRSYQEQIVELQKIRQVQVQKLNYLRGKVVKSKVSCERLLSELVKKEVRITGEINKLN